MYMYMHVILQVHVPGYIICILTLYNLYMYIVGAPILYGHYGDNQTHNGPLTQWHTVTCSY